MEKYYTPNIEELHIGFEYEYDNSDFNPKNPWIKVEMPWLAYVNPDKLRVKYLDRGDIESLGFTLFDRFVDNYCGDFFEYYIHEDNKVILEFQSCIPYITIRAKETKEFPSKSYYCFQGNIKNKSELKKLLKQLCIIK